MHLRRCEIGVLVQFHEVLLTVVLFVSIRHIEHISCATDCTVIVISGHLTHIPGRSPVKGEEARRHRVARAV